MSLPNEKYKKTKSEKQKLNKEKVKDREQINKAKSKANFKEKLIKQKFKIMGEESIHKIETTPEYYNNTKFNLRIGKSTIENAGLGVFTLEKIPSNTHIGNYEGKKSTKKTGIYLFELSNKINIDANDYPRCYIAMINDVYKSENKINCEFLIDVKKKLIEIWSIVDIDVGVELFVSYGNDYWSDN
jgi:hypothetical protein